MLAHPHTLAQFNAWANARLHNACSALPPEAVSEDRAAFFGSILGTLNHILLVDILYRERLEKAGIRFAGLSGDDLVEMIELPDHPWVMASQFHPEFTSTPLDGHPLFTGFIEAGLKYQTGELPAQVASL